LLLYYAGGFCLIRTSYRRYRLRICVVSDPDPNFCPNPDPGPGVDVGAGVAYYKCFISGPDPCLGSSPDPGPSNIDVSTGITITNVQRNEDLMSALDYVGIIWYK
jgi:hypothetical protein